MVRTVTALRCALLVSGATLLAVEAQPARAAAPIQQGSSTPSSADVAACLRSPRCGDVFIVAHRARGYGGPENSREAIRNTISAGQLMIEIDLRRTRDGEVVVFRHRRLEAVTSGQGEIADLPVASLAQVYLKNGEPIPRFREVYDLTRGRAVLDLHFKVDAVEAVAQWIASHGSFDDVLFYLDRSDLVQSAARLSERYPSMMLMIRARARSDLWKARSLFGRLPEVIRIPAAEPTEVSWFRRKGVKVAIRIPHLDPILPHQWIHARSRALRSGAQLIVVDEPRPFLLERDQPEER